MPPKSASTQSASAKRVIGENEREVEDAKAKKAKAFSSISSKDDFHREFGPLGYAFPNILSSALRPGAWGADNIQVKLIEWLSSQSGEWASTYYAIRTRPNERSLYPFVFEILKSLVLTVDAVICDVKIGDAQISDDSVTAGVRDFVDSKSPPSSPSQSLEEASASSAVSAASSSARQNLIDVLDEKEVKGVFIEVEKFIKEHHQKEAPSGRAEFSIKDCKSQMTFCVFEIKPNIDIDDNAGLFQLASELIIVSHMNKEIEATEAGLSNFRAPEMVYGVYTDAHSYRFVCLETATKTITLSNTFGFFVRSSNPELALEAINVASYLFHLFGLSPDISVSDTVAAIALLKAEKGRRFSRTINLLRDQLLPPSAK
jgi:hypothetical protein